MDVLYRGPNSIVYRTYSEQLGKNVIIKRHNEECQSSIFLRNKFAKEFKTGCTLAGPHVVPYISLEIAERTEYIVMEDTNSLSLEAITQQKVM
jgi:serine/threonine protein kinase